MVLRVDVEGSPAVVAHRLLPARRYRRTTVSAATRRWRAVRVQRPRRWPPCVSDGIVGDRFASRRLRVEVRPQRARLAGRERAFQRERPGCVPQSARNPVVRLCDASLALVPGAMSD